MPTRPRRTTPTSRKIVDSFGRRRQSKSARGPRRAVRREFVWRSGFPIAGLSYTSLSYAHHGVWLPQARRAGRSRFGGDGIMTFVADLKFALRSLLRAKGLSLTVVLTLALGIGANAAIFSVVRGVLLRPDR